MNDLSGKTYFPNITYVVNEKVFIVITGINEPKSWAKYISYDCKCRSDGEN